MTRETTGHRGRRAGSTPWARRRRALLWTLLLILVSPILIVSVYRWNNDRRVAAQLDAIRASGLPATIDEAHAWDKARQKERKAIAQAPAATPEKGVKTVADTYKEAFQLANRPEVVSLLGEALDAMRKLPIGQPVPREILEKMRAAIEANRDTLRMLHAAAGLLHGRFPLDLSQGFEVDLSHLARLRESVRLLRMESLVAASDGDIATAVSALNAALAASRMVSDEPTAISQLIHTAVHNECIEGLNDLLARGGLSGDELSRLQAAFLEGNNPAAMPDTFAVERAFGVEAYENPAAFVEYLGEQSWLDDILPGSYRAAIQMAGTVGWFDHEQEQFIEYMGQIVEASRLPYPEAIPAMRAIEERIGEPFLVPRIFDAIIPAMIQTETAAANDAANMSCGAAATAIERYRQTYGAPPESLQALTPEFLPGVPADPFDGQPLRYRRQGGGYLVYSIGADGVDDNGAPHNSYSAPEPSGDVIFQVKE